MNAPNLAPAVDRPAPVAEWPMLRELDSEIAQQVFHVAMEAFARPGTVHRLPMASAQHSALGGVQHLSAGAASAPVGGVPRPVPAVVAPLLALADIMTPIAAVAAGGSEADAAVAVAARLVNTRVVAPEDARFALAFAEPDDLSTLNRGSHWSPETGAMLFQRVESIETVADAAAAGSTWRLTGPGVKPGAPVLLRIGGLSERFVAARAERVSDYPAGIDILLVTDEGEVTGLPRTTVITVQDGAN